MSCPRCGSWSVRRDRSLAGRMVCGRCGMPLGNAGGPAVRARRSGVRRLPRLRGVWRWVVPLAVLLAVSAQLASLRPEPPRALPRSGVLQ